MMRLRASVIAAFCLLARAATVSAVRGANASTTKARLSVSAPRCCLAEGQSAFQRPGRGIQRRGLNAARTNTGGIT